MRDLKGHHPYTCDIVAFVKRLITCLQFDQNEDSGYILRFMNAFNSGSIATMAELYGFILSIEKKNEKKSTGKDIRQSVPMQKASSVQQSSPVQQQPPSLVNNPIPTPKQMTPKQAQTPVMMPSIPEIPQIPSAPKQSNAEKGSKPSLFGKPKDKKQDKSKNKLFGGKSAQEIDMPFTPAQPALFRNP